MRKEIRKRLNEKLKLLKNQEVIANENENFDEKRIVGMKRRFLSKMALSGEESISIEPVVFISYSESGAAHVESAKEVCSDFGLSYKTGHDPEVQIKKNLLRAIMAQIGSCSLFLGIWTPEYHCQKIRSESQSGQKTAPSVWLMEEKGIAQGFNLPLRLLIDNSIHEDFFQKTSQGELHHRFTSANFGTMLEGSIEALQQRFHERSYNLTRREYVP